jgi:hypothetical protein
MTDAALPHLKKLETAGLIRIKPGRRKSFTLTNSGEALRGFFHDMTYQEKQDALKDFLKGSSVESIEQKKATKKAPKKEEEKPKNELEKLMEIEERLESPTISKTSVIPHATIMVAPYKDGFVSSYQYYGKKINGQDTGQSISTPLDLSNIYATREIAIKAAARKIRERAESDKNKVALNWLDTIAPKPKPEKLDSISFELDGDKATIEYFLDSDGVYTRRDTEIYKDDPKKEVVSELTFSQYKDEEPGWYMAGTIQSMDMQPLLVTKAEAQRMIAAERKEAEKSVAEEKAAKEKPKTKAEINKERQAKKKEVHIEGKKEEPVTSKTIEESMEKAVSKVDYAKIKTAVKNQFDQAIKRATIQTDKEWDSSTKDDNSYVTIDIPGDGKFKVKNNVERLKEMQSKVTNAVVPKAAKEPSGPSSGSIEAFKAMVDDKDMENAIEYAKLKGLDPKTVKLTPTQRTTVDKYLKNPAEFERQTAVEEEKPSDKELGAARERLDKEMAREEESRFRAILDTTIRSTESQLREDIKKNKISSMDAEAMLFVFPNYPEGVVKPYTIKLLEKFAAGIEVKDEDNGKPGSFVESAAKDFLKKAQDDFMIGDDVRVGNSPGPVVGLEGDYIKFRPDTAKNLKAYQRVQKKNVTFVSRPERGLSASASKNEEEVYGVEDGNFKIDKEGTIQNMGQSMYSANLIETGVKELLQNAFDAVKGAVSDFKSPSLYKTGKISIDIDSDKRTIKVSDNARGMDIDIVRDAFFTVSGTDKSDLRPEERSGGLGLAKIGFMISVAKLKLDTVRDGVRIKVDATGDEIARSKFKIYKTPALKNEHGTTVEIEIPETYTDEKGQVQKIYFWSDPKYIDTLQHPLIGPVEVAVTTHMHGDTKTTVLPVGVNFNEKATPFLTKANFDWGSADIYFGVERKDNPRHQVLSSGVYQFTGPNKYATYFQLSKQEKIPYDIIVNVKSSVKAQSLDYPFENSRESFKDRIKADIESLEAFLARVARGEEAKDLKESFEGIVSMPRVEVGEDVAEVSKKLKKVFDQRNQGTQETKVPEMPKEIVIKDNVVSDKKGYIIYDKEKEEEKKKASTFQAETEAPTRDKFMIDMKQDPKLPIFHNNTNVDFIEVGKKYGDPEQFFAELGTLMIEMKEELAKNNVSGLRAYDILSPENLFFGGISVDKGYGGVHIKVPYKAVLLNPFYNWGAQSLFGVRQNLLNTMIHEIAHTGDMEHGVGHNGQMIKVEQYLADQGLLDYYRDALLDILARHESTFTAMKEEYGKSTTKNTAKSLEDINKGAKSARGDEGGGADEIPKLPARAGQRRNESVRSNLEEDGEGEEYEGSAREQYLAQREADGREDFKLKTSKSVKDMLLGSYGAAREAAKAVKESPMLAVNKMTSKLDRAITYARIKGVWYGRGLEVAEVKDRKSVV